jgi:hypothetical protein
MTMPKKPKDIKLPDFPQLLWEENKIPASLDLLYEYVIRYAIASSNWYSERRSTKKNIGFLLRLGAVIGTATAGIIPILGEIFKKDNDVPLINPAWSTVAIAIVALFIAIDNFGGYTSGWIRYMLTEQKINELIAGFRFQWEKNKLARISGNVSLDFVAKAVESCELFLFKVYEEVRNETGAWAAEFQTAIKEIEKTTKMVSATHELGAIDLEVSNGDECENGWTVRLDDKPEKDCQGKFVSLPDLTPKIHTVRIEGKIAGKPVAKEKSVAVISGQVIHVVLQL